MPNEIERLKKARDSQMQYDDMRTVYLHGQITWEQLRPYRAAKEKAQKEIRSAVKRGTHAQTERDLKKKYPQHYAN